MTDTAEYWNDIKRRSFTPTYYCLQGIDCGYSHKYETTKIHNVSCRGCLEIISKDCELSEKRQNAILSQKRKQEHARRKKKGYKLQSIIKFGKYKGYQRTLQWVIDNDNSYFRWMQGKVLFHPEVDVFINKLKED